MAYAHRRSSLLILFSLLVSAGFIFAAIFIAQAQAQVQDISYPIAELGGCTSEEECRAYCDDLSHVEECTTFAEEHGLMSADEVQQARAFAALGGQGPGGCTSRQSCEAYCEDVRHIDECLVFGEQHGLVPADELDEARAISSALAQGAELPGGCTTKSECEAYCSSPSNMRECIAFAEAAGFMDEEELREAHKVADYMESGGEMPGGCQSERECRAYCEDESHIQECMEFAVDAGFASEEEAELFRKTGGVGPGGCRGRECEAYCQDPAHRQECVEFATEHGLLSDEELQQMRGGMQRAKDALEQASPETRRCIEEALGSEAIAEIESGEFAHGSGVGEAMEECFNKDAGGGLSDIPDEVRSCAERELGRNLEEAIQEEGHEAIEPILRPCFEEFQAEAGLGEGRPPPSDSGEKNPDRFFSGMPPEVIACVRERDPGAIQAIEQGTIPGSDFESLMRSCFAAFNQAQSESVDMQHSEDEAFHEGGDEREFYEGGENMQEEYYEGEYSEEGSTDGDSVEESDAETTESADDTTDDSTESTDSGTQSRLDPRSLLTAIFAVFGHDIVLPAE